MPVAWSAEYESGCCQRGEWSATLLSSRLQPDFQVATNVWQRHCHKSSIVWPEFACYMAFGDMKTRFEAQQVCLPSIFGGSNDSARLSPCCKLCKATCVLTWAWMACYTAYQTISQHGTYYWLKILVLNLLRSIVAKLCLHLQILQCGTVWSLSICFWLKKQHGKLEVFLLIWLSNDIVSSSYETELFLLQALCNLAMLFAAN